MIAGRLVMLLLLAAGTAAQAQQQAQPPATARLDPPYLVHAGDELDVNVWGEERLQRNNLKVLPDGTIDYPLAGKVQAIGLTPEEIAARISKGLAREFRGTVPQVTVTIRVVTGTQFFVLGKVRSPGLFTPGRNVNVLEAISYAGGPAEFAQLGKVVILRRTGDHTEALRVKLDDVLKGQVGDAEASQLPVLRYGDTVIVP